LPKAIAAVVAVPQPPRSSGEADMLLAEAEEAWFFDAVSGEEIEPCAAAEGENLEELVVAVVFAPTLEKGVEALKKRRLRYLGESEAYGYGYYISTEW